MLLESKNTRLQDVPWYVWPFYTIKAGFFLLVPGLLLALTHGQGRVCASVHQLGNPVPENQTVENGNAERAFKSTFTTTHTGCAVSTNEHRASAVLNRQSICHNRALRSCPQHRHRASL